MSNAADFTGSVPTFYDRYLGPVLFEPYAADLASRLIARARVLELACGTGIVTRRLRKALPASATLLATDLNQAMIAYAQTSVPHPGIEWHTADAQALPFAEASFDAVVCQYGLMFLPDKAQGFREVRRVLAPGGVLLANVWHSMDANPFARAMHARLTSLFPDNPPRFFETPYGYYDQDRLRADAAAGGWAEVRLDEVRFQSSSLSGRLRDGLRPWLATLPRAGQPRRGSR